MKLIVGLGNPGKKYIGTRHNIGADLVRSIDSLSGAKLFVADAFMNESGPAVASALKKWRIKPKDLIVIHDELDLPLGEIRIAVGRSSAGHKGVQSIIDALGTKNFTRIRLGICPADKTYGDAAEFVLKKFDPAEKTAVESMRQRAAAAIADAAGGSRPDA